MVRWLARRLKKMEAYRGNVSTRPRCIRIDFPDEFHMDVVPMVKARIPGRIEFPGTPFTFAVPLAGDMGRSSGNLLVPNAAVNGWEVTNPKGLREWYRQQNHRTNGMFTRVARMLKHWRNQAFDAPVRPPSAAFEVMMANSWPFFAFSDASAVSGVLRQISTSFSYARPSAMNPSLRGEDLLRNWSRDNHEVFMTELRASAVLAEQALREPDEGRSIGLWQYLFHTRFPQRGD